ncbi:MAG: hypothetical protein CBC22_06885 [Alphaproteobacteria bacterium TMED62]|nr:MAG: hypothetical protein CBC22_06885 [Alphaproteobacteria bacterium TMED62]|tara:strand:+ start:20760 stop:23456 length:2697 start_codon:yes stop_codon:yes gene_type:complete
MNIIGFSNIYALFGLMIAPLIWIIVKSFPPIPKNYNFSSLYLLQNINYNSSKNDKTPLWLLIFRLFFFILIVLFFSKPHIKNSESLNTKKFDKYVIIADIGWSMANDWIKFKKIVSNISKEAERNNKNIIFYHSSLKNYKNAVTFKSSESITAYLKNLSPLPIKFKESYLKYLLENESVFKNSKLFLISSIYDFENFSDHLKNYNFIKKNSSQHFFINPVETLLAINKLEINQNKIICKITRIGKSDFEQNFYLNVYTINDELIYKDSHTINAEDRLNVVNLSFPIELINQIKYIEIVGQNHAGAKYYFDDFSKKKNIAILSDNEFYKESPLLSPIYYLNKSLDTKHFLTISTIDKIINQNYSTIIVPETIKISNELENNLNSWLLNGGTLIRFAGQSLVGQKSDFLPFQDSLGTIRSIDGQLTINKNLYISEFQKNSIFFGLKIPSDITIMRQLIFNEISDKVNILAKLNDDTPLVSMRNIGQGKIILFHIGANNNWSDLPISSLFPEMLNRVLLFSKYKSSTNLEGLNLTKELDGFGNLIQTKKIINVNTFNEIKNSQPSMIIPPGKYENDQISVALNLSTNIINPYSEKASKYNSITDYSFNDIKDLSPVILKILLTMFILDILITIMIKNNISFYAYLNRGSNLIFLLLFPLVFFHFESSNANDTYLAYIKIKNKEINEISENGLNNLKNLLSARTAISPKGVIGLDLIYDDIFSYPLIYWPLTKNLLKIKKVELKKINNYINNGGIILFDVIGFSRSSLNLKDNEFKAIRNFLSSIEVKTLTVLPKNHTLTKSFYLLKKFPGKWDNRVLLIENNNLEYKDGVSSIILGFNDWAKAWSLDKNNIPLFPLVPGGERQRELSYRFGINIVMYSLTGNYKSDQIHSKSILNRLSKTN